MKIKAYFTDSDMMNPYELKLEMSFTEAAKMFRGVSFTNFKFEHDALKSWLLKHMAHECKEAGINFSNQILWWVSKEGKFLNPLSELNLYSIDKRRGELTAQVVSSVIMLQVNLKDQILKLWHEDFYEAQTKELIEAARQKDKTLVELLIEDHNEKQDAVIQEWLSEYGFNNAHISRPEIFHA